MKLNKTMTMAALIAGTVFAAGVAAQAQDSTNTPPPATRAPGVHGGRMNFDSIATQLALTDDQKAKAKPVFQDMIQKMSDMRNDSSLSQTDKRAKAKQIRDDANTQLKEIFTPEQYEKWQKTFSGNRRGAGAGAPPPAGGTTPPPAGGSTPPQQ
jgi:Spy/CpxP family protein refolding chaperone